MALPGLQKLRNTRQHLKQQKIPFYFFAEQLDAISHLFFLISYILWKKTPSTICLILRWCPHLQWCWSILLHLWNQKAQLNYNEARYAWLLRRPVGAINFEEIASELAE